jgi:predicted component of type VI protein secretion system
MSNSGTAFPNVGTHAWLHRLERSQGVRLGDWGSYPLSKPANAFAVQIDQRLGFNSEPRAFWYPANDRHPPKLEWNDLGIFAPLGPLPEHLTETLLQSQGGARLHQLVNSLLQRLTHLYYRAWAQLRPECEMGRPDDRFTALLGLMAGSEGPSIPQLPSHQPPVHQLPQLAFVLFGISVHMERGMVTRRSQPNPPPLGSARLGHARLGLHVPTFGLGSMRLWIRPQNAADFAAWSNHRHTHRQRFEQFVRQFLPVGAYCDIRVQTPLDMPVAHLNSSALGQTCLSR